MSDLQIGLLVIGALAVAAVLIYNRVQERSVRRDAERAFSAKRPDVLLEEPAQRREPTLDAPASVPVDSRMDYVVELEGGDRAALRQDLSALEQRYPRRVSIDERSVALQMVSRDGVLSEAQLREFHSRVEALARKHGASVRAPEVRAALAGAQALDRACAEVDVQIALHVLGGKALQPGGTPFSVAPRPDGITLLLDVPRTADLSRSYETMARTARGLGGRIVDDNGNALDERALAAIGAQVDALGSRLGQLGIEPGSPLAQRLFS